MGRARSRAAAAPAARSSSHIALGGSFLGASPSGRRDLRLRIGCDVIVSVCVSSSIRIAFGRPKPAPSRATCHRRRREGGREEGGGSVGARP